MSIENLLKTEREKGILIAAHRGVAGGNIPCNTRSAFNAALHQGADILETDVTVCGDGTLFIFHPGTEHCLLNLQDTHIENMTADEVKKLRYVNGDDTITEDPLMTLDEFLETYKNRCLINLDHVWHEDMEQVLKVVKQHGMEEQILMKAPAELQYAKMMEELAPKMMFMPIISQEDNITQQLEKMNINFVGMELVFYNEAAPIVSDKFIKYHHDKGRMLWGNAIIYDYKAQIAAGHSDDVAIGKGDMDYGWGWYIDKGFDIIQTDWVLDLNLYMKGRGVRD